MLVAAAAGRGDVLALCGSGGGNRVAFSDGTYSAPPASLLAAKTMVSYLVEHEAEIYPRLAELSTEMRRVITQAFAAEGVSARCTDGPNDLVPGCSLTAVHFPHDDETPLDWPHVLRDPAFCDTVLSQKALQIALLLEDTYTLFGSFAASVAHSEADVERLGEACRAAARRIKRYL